MLYNPKYGVVELHVFAPSAGTFWYNNIEKPQSCIQEFNIEEMLQNVPVYEWDRRRKVVLCLDFILINFKSWDNFNEYIYLRLFINLSI